MPDNRHTQSHSAIRNRVLVVGIALILIYASIAGGGFATAQKTIGTQNNSSQATTGTHTAPNASQNNGSKPLTPALEIKNSTTDLNHVVLTSVTLPENGYIVAYGENFSLRAPTNDAIIGRTQYVRHGQFSNVVVRFNHTIPKNTTVTVMIHNETNGDDKFDFASRNSPDGPYLNETGYPILDQVQIINNSTAIESGSVSPSKLSEQGHLPPGASGRLVITANGSGGAYNFSATGRITPQTTAPNTTVNNSTVTGSFNSSNISDGTNSSTFTYSGAISSFQTSGDVNVRLNGRNVDPSVLGANWITLTKNGSKVQPGRVEYGFTASKAIVPGGNTEANDTTTDRRINGTIGGNDPTDTIYYAGKMTQSRLVGDSKVIINGRVTSDSTGNNTGNTGSGTSPGTATGTPNLGQLPGQGNGGSSTNTPAQQGGEGPDFRVSNITLSSHRVEVSQEFSVTVTITNTGSSKVNANLGLASEGEVVDSASAGLFAGGSRQITFKHTYDATGKYVLKIALLNDNGDVSAMSTIDQTITVVPEGSLKTTTANASNTTSSGGPGFGVPAGILGLLVATRAIRYWRQSK